MTGWANIKPVSPEVAREVMGQWSAMQPFIDRHARSAAPGYSPPQEVWDAPPPKRRSPQLADDKTRSKIKTLYDHGVEPEFLAERFGMDLDYIGDILRAAGVTRRRK